MAGYSPLSEDPALIATGNSIGLECLLPRLLGVAVDKTAGDVINDRRSRIQPLASNLLSLCLYPKALKQNLLRAWVSGALLSLQ